MAGKCLPALDLFAMVIKKMRDDLKGGLTDVTEKDIYFVIIVPALLQESRVMNLIINAAIKVLLFICSVS